mmetsp:Transcript_32433/g.97976  ORF Transcript_32433/g.97976 Transcript_32433/m.97976 type:complete len:226 (-) Transcript_32433:1990-2667(-)
MQPSSGTPPPRYRDSAPPTRRPHPASSHGGAGREEAEDRGRGGAGGAGGEGLEAGRAAARARGGCAGEQAAQGPGAGDVPDARHHAQRAAFRVRRHLDGDGRGRHPAAVRRRAGQRGPEQRAVHVRGQDPRELRGRGRSGALGERVAGGLLHRRLVLGARVGHGRRVLRVRRQLPPQQGVEKGRRALRSGRRGGGLAEFGQGEPEFQHHQLVQGRQASLAAAALA